MSWNECLYWYAQERGGSYYGLWPSGFLTRTTTAPCFWRTPKGPILICTKVTSSGRYGTYRDVAAAVQVELERPLYPAGQEAELPAGGGQHATGPVWTGVPVFLGKRRT